MEGLVPVSVLAQLRIETGDDHRQRRSPGESRAALEALLAQGMMLGPAARKLGISQERARRILNT
jgi:hypothetical protein